jgi:ribosomal protein L11 methyltransferase
MRDYILEITFDPSLEDAVQSRLFLTRSSGSSTSDTGVVSAYFDWPEDREAAVRAFEGLDVDLTPIERERVDWLQIYQQSLRPIVIGERFIVAPDATLIEPDANRMAIVVPQEQAFGTGSHETTALCMEMLERIPLAGRRGLDVGSGSGILAIAMHLLGMSRVIAFDNDPDAYGALRDNRIRNRVPESRMPLFIGGVEALRGGTFDVITMNIIPEVILPLLGHVVTHLADEALLILSGILLERRDEVLRAAHGHRLDLRDEAQRGEWWCGVFSGPR